MEKYSIEDYLNLKNEIENIKSKKKDIEPQIEELQKQKSVLESNYNELQEHVVQIKALTELQRNLKLHQFAEKNRLKEKLEKHYEDISTIEMSINTWKDIYDLSGFRILLIRNNRKIHFFKFFSDITVKLGNKKTPESSGELVQDL